MKEITSRRNKMTQIVTDEEWQWLKDRHRTRDFSIVEMSLPKALILPKLITKEILKPKIEVQKPKTKTKK
jgi:hypothetical protein